MSVVDTALLVLRVWVGIVMIAHGINHGKSLDGTANWFRKVGFRAPRFHAYLSSSNELAIGAALILGLLTAVAAAGLAAIMFVAFWAIHRFAGFFVFHRPDEGYEYVATLSFIALALAIAGPGSLSVDTALGIDLTGWVGAGIIAAGLALAGVQVAVLWRKPE